MTTPKDMDFELHVPRGTAEKFTAAVDAIPEDMRVYWRFHRVENGETLSDVARRYHTTTTAIAEANNLEGTELVKDSKLIIPVSPVKASVVETGSSAHSSSSVGYSKHASRYTVRKGDTVLSVADDFGVPAEKVRQWNRLKGNALRPGRSLTIFKPAGAVLERTSESVSYSRSHADAPESKSHRGTPTVTKNAKGAGKSSEKSEDKDSVKSSAKGKGRTKSAEKEPAPKKEVPKKEVAKKEVAKKEVAKSPAKAAPVRSKKHKQQG
jgi:membrane-bound lytic murein transglycosylase D